MPLALFFNAIFLRDLKDIISPNMALLKNPIYAFSDKINITLKCNTENHALTFIKYPTFYK